MGGTGTITYDLGQAEGSNIRSRWESLLSQCYYPLETDVLKNVQQFSGLVRVRDFGDITVSQMHSGGHKLMRTRRGISQSSRQSVLFVIPTRGHFHFNHRGREDVVRVGNALLINTNEPYATVCSDFYSNICFEVTQSKLEYEMSAVEDACGRVITLDQASTLFFSQTMNLMLAFDDHRGLEPVVARDISRSVIHLAATNLSMHATGGGDLAAGRYKSKILERIKVGIQEKLCDPDLGPVTIAAANGVSVSYLHKLFRVSGNSVNRWILERRLDLCRERLASRNFAHASITEIAFASGFSNAAHFSTCFRRRFGISAKEMRAGNTAGTLRSPYEGTDNTP